MTSGATTPMTSAVIRASSIGLLIDSCTGSLLRRCIQGYLRSCTANKRIGTTPEQKKRREKKRGSGRLLLSSLRLNFLTPRNATITENSLVFLIPGYSCTQD